MPPLPGRTVILLSSDTDNCETMKQDFCLPPDPEQNKDEDDEENEGDEDHKRRSKNPKDDDKLSPTVRTYFLLISNDTSRK